MINKYILHKKHISLFFCLELIHFLSLRFVFVQQEKRDEKYRERVKINKIYVYVLCVYRLVLHIKGLYSKLARGI